MPNRSPTSSSRRWGSSSAEPARRAGAPEPSELIEPARSDDGPRRRSVPNARPDARRHARRGATRVPASGQGQPPGRGRRGRAASIPGDPGRLRHDRRPRFRETSAGRGAAGEPEASLGSRSRPRPTPRTGPTAAGRAGRARPVGPGAARGPSGSQRGSGRRRAHRVRARRDPSDRRTRRRSARRPTTVPRPSRSSPTGAERPGTGRRRGRTGRSIPRSTPIRASTDRSTRHAPAGSCTGGMRRGSTRPDRRRRPLPSASAGRPARACGLRAAMSRRWPRIRPRRGGRPRPGMRPAPRARRPPVRAAAARQGPPASDPAWSPGDAARPRGDGDRGPPRGDRGPAATAAGTSSDAAVPGRIGSGLTPEGILEAVRSWLDDDRPGAMGRIARAIVGWAPIALGIGWVAGEISGCGRFAAGCDDAEVMSAWLVQIAALVALIVVGRLARIASVATLATLAAAIPAALLLSATGKPRRHGSRPDRAERLARDRVGRRARVRDRARDPWDQSPPRRATGGRGPEPSRILRAHAT